MGSNGLCTVRAYEYHLIALGYPLYLSNVKHHLIHAYPAHAFCALAADNSLAVAGKHSGVAVRVAAGNGSDYFVAGSGVCSAVAYCIALMYGLDLRNDGFQAHHRPESEGYLH